MELEWDSAEMDISVFMLVGQTQRLVRPRLDFVCERLSGQTVWFWVRPNAHLDAEAAPGETEEP